MGSNPVASATVQWSSGLRQQLANLYNQRFESALDLMSYSKKSISDNWSLPKRIAVEVEDIKYDGRTRSVPGTKKYKCIKTKADHDFKLISTKKFSISHGKITWISKNYRCICGKKNMDWYSERTPISPESISASHVSLAP